MQKKVNKAICKIRFCIFCQVCKNFLIWQSASAFQCSGAIKKLFFFMSQITGMAIFAFLFTTMINVCAKFIAKNCGNKYTEFVHNIFFHYVFWMQIENHDKQNIILLQENRNLFHNILKFSTEVIIVLKFPFSSIYRVLIYEPYNNLE